MTALRPELQTHSHATCEDVNAKNASSLMAIDGRQEVLLGILRGRRSSDRAFI